MSLSSTMCLTTMDYLTDEMNTMCILLYGLSEQNNDFRSFKHTWTHHNDKGINKSMINLIYYSVLYIYCQNGKKVYVLGSQFIRKLCLHGYKSVTKLHRNGCNQFLKSQNPFIVYRSTSQIYYCVLLTMLNVIGHY